MSSTLKRNYRQTERATEGSGRSFISRGRIREQAEVIAPKASFAVVTLALVALLSFSFINGQLFFTELAICSFIILSLMIIKLASFSKTTN